jgi:hypothetical protein
MQQTKKQVRLRKELKPMDNPDDYEVCIRHSPIHRYGLFTLIDRKKGDLIVPYNYTPDMVMGWLDFKNKYNGDLSYSYSNKRKWQVINCKEKRNLVCFTNDNRPNHNCELKAYALYAIKDIPAESELTLSYAHYDPRDYIKKKIVNSL